MTFNYHMFGTTMGTLSVEINGVVVWSATGNQGSLWLSNMIDLSCYSGVVNVAIVGLTGTSFTSDMAVDNVCFIEQPGPMIVQTPVCYDFSTDCIQGIRNGSGGLAWNYGTTTTPSTGTGPQGADADGGSGFFFTESSGSLTNTLYRMEGVFNISTLRNPYLTFDYHMFGSTMGSLTVKVNGSTVFTSSGDMGNQWRSAVVDLNGFSGNVSIAIEGLTGTSFTSDMAIDNFCVKDFIVPSSGTSEITTCEGNIYDPGGTADYPNSADGYTVIYPSDPNGQVQLTGSYTTENTYDFVLIYDGPSPLSPLLFSGTGSGLLPLGIQSSTPGSPLTVRFLSDGSVTNPGFDFNISCILPCITPNLTYTLSGTSPICQGSSTNITLSGSQSGVSYQLLRNGTALNAPLPGTGSSLNFGSYSTAGTYTIQVFGGSGFCNGPFTLSSNFTLSVSTPPTAPTNITGNANINCGDQTVLTISGGSNGSGATYQWYEGGCGIGSIIGTGPSIAPSPTTTTTYYVRRRGSLPCNVITACASVTVNVSTPSPPTVSDEFICPGQSATFTATGAPSGGSYVWFSDAAGTNQVGSGSTFTTPNLLTTTTYYVQSTSSQPTQTYSQTIQISNPGLSASNLFNYLSTPQGAVGTGSLILTAVGDLDGTGTNLEQWSIANEAGQNIGVLGGTGVGGDQCSNTLTTTISLSSADINAWAANGSIEFSAEDLTGFINNTLCGNDFLEMQLVYDYTTGPSPCVSSLVSVDAIVEPNPNLSYSITGGGTICAGNTSIIGINGSQTNVSYQLLRNGVATNAPLPGTGSALSFGGQSVAGTYTVQVFGGTGFCTGPFTLPGSVTITVNQPPTAPTNVNGINSITCGQSTTLSVSGGSAGSGTTYEWYADGCGSGPILGVGTLLTVSPISTTTYYVRRVGVSPCSNITSCASLQVTVNPLPSPLTVGADICEGSSATITASGAGTGQGYLWYSDPAGTNIIGSGPTYNTPNLNTTTTYYAAINGNNSGTVAPSPQTSVFSTNTRGYYFTAPSDFVITGVFVPTNASSGPQNIAVVKFPAAPPTFSTTTNNFTTVFYTANNTSAGYIPVSIPVSAGEIIGFLGTRSTTDVNSYGTFSQININGVNVNVTRLGMQFPLSTTAPQDLWSETTSSKSRVFFTYDSKACESNLVPTVVNVDQQPTAPSAISGTTTITLSLIHI